MYADLGPGQMLDLDPLSPNGVDLLYSHEYVAGKMKSRASRRRALSIANEQTNLYVYVDSNPIRYVDPMGLEPITIGVGASFPAEQRNHVPLHSLPPVDL